DNCGPENLAVDFVDVTCLIQREGYNKYIFIHKSIQEYHAAEFIRNISSDKKPKFYNLIMEDIKQNNYRYHNTISFLQETDEIDCKKNLVIPLCEHYKIHKWNDMEIVDYKDLFREFFVDSTAQVVINNGNYSVQALNYSTTFMSWIAFFENEMYYDLYNIVTNILFSHENSRSLPEEIFTVTKDGISQISLILLINRMDLFDIALDAFIKQVREIYQHLYVNSSVTIKNETESINEFFDL
ncbi:TPA: hypothetical protein R4X75_005449, partial [Klebsiella pneumoniae]|nr:hypothetical protein [Klebsiella pneumoniae]